MYKIVVILDEVSKRMVKLANSVLASEYITVVNNLLEIQEDMFDEQKTVIILDGLLQSKDKIAELVLYQNVAKFNYLFLLKVPQNTKIVAGLGRVYQCDTSMIDFELIQASLYKDNSFVVENDIPNKSALYAKNIIESKGSTENVQLARDYLLSLERESILSEQIAKQQETLDELLIKNTILSEENQKWSIGCKTLLERAKKQNDALKRYERVFSQDVYYKFNLHNYQNKPVIVYLKIFTEFNGINTFIETIVDAFRFQQRHSVKVLQLFDSSGNRKMRLLPNYYHILRNHYVMQEVITNDYLCKSGDYANLLDRLLSNKYGLDVLVIVDCKDHDDVVLSGSFLQYNLCQTAEQAAILALSQNTTVINQKLTGWLTWIPIRTDHLTKKEKFIKLSSRPVIQKILTMSEKLANSF